jgi:hypothetical protein
MQESIDHVNTLIFQLDDAIDKIDAHVNKIQPDDYTEELYQKLNDMDDTLKATSFSLNTVIENSKIYQTMYTRQRRQREYIKYPAEYQLIELIKSGMNTMAEYKTKDEAINGIGLIRQDIIQVTRIRGQVPNTYNIYDELILLEAKLLNLREKMEDILCGE